MKVHIKLVGFLSKSGLPNGYKGGELDVSENATLAEILTLLEVPSNSPLMIVVNGKAPSQPCTLTDEDVIEFVPRIGGG